MGEKPTTEVTEAIYIALVGNPLQRVQMADSMKQIQRGERRLVHSCDRG